MPVGSFANYADPRDEREMKRRMDASGLLPSVGPSHQALMWKQLERIKQGVEINPKNGTGVCKPTGASHTNSRWIGCMVCYDGTVRLACVAPRLNG